MTMQTKFPFAYRFVAFYDDETSFIQTDDDVSLVDPARSAFFDVMENHNKLVYFALGGEGNENAFAVNVRTGQFSVNGAVFTVHPNDLKVKPETVRLVYHRTVRQHRHMDVNGKGETLKTRDETEVVSFHLGWSCTDESGVDHRFILEIPSKDGK